MDIVNKYLNWVAVAFLIVFLFLQGCNSEMNYESLVEKELSSGVQNDSLFLGYHFGMEREEFRNESWKMNQQGIMTGFVDIYYEFDDLKSTATMEFYPTFTNDKISRIPVRVSYNSWSPWNEEYWTAELQKDLVEYYSEDYDIEFNEIYVPEIEKTAFVNIEGNREIRIYPVSESQVMVDFIDLNVHNINQD
jgi:hypothetical protein